MQRHQSTPKLVSSVSAVEEKTYINHQAGSMQVDALKSNKTKQKRSKSNKEILFWRRIQALAAAVYSV